MRDWQVLGDQVRSRVEAADKGTAVAFAAATAERLMRLDPHRRPFTESLRPLLDLVWRAASGDQTAFKPIAVALGEYYIGEYCHNDGQHGPDDADDDPAAAILYAAECYFHMMPGLPRSSRVAPSMQPITACSWPLRPMTAMRISILRPKPKQQWQLRPASNLPT